MNRLNSIQNYFTHSIKNGKGKENTIQECLNRLKTYQEKDRFIRFVEQKG
ncbi:hypothetical protein AAGG74_18990 [Bacillus mexicanus]